MITARARFVITTIIAMPVAAMGQAPLVDHHQHLFSPGTIALITPRAMLDSLTAIGKPPQPITASTLIALLDSAGIKRAVVLSMGYTWGAANRTVQDEYSQVRADNDWTSQQVSLYPDRLRGFCSFNPVKPYALEELDRCLKDPRLRGGLKLHIANSGVDYHNSEHITRVREVFRRANAHGMAIVVHMRASISRRLAYGREEAQIFIDSLLTAAPDVPVQVAHLAGAGGFDKVTDAALSAFLDAIARRDPRMKNVWFDQTTVVLDQTTGEELKDIADRIRRLGVERVLFGSDAAVLGNTPRANWTNFRRLPLTEAEFHTIATNVAPYLGRQ